jgi:eukaryotic-like serine/threonine-protein kinase
MNIEKGSTINQYKIISAIGKGGMGEVFLAQDTKLDRKVALKILPSEFAEDTERMSRFVREAKSASALNHPNILTIHEIGESDGTHFIATEFIDRKTLNDYKKANPLNYKSALEIAIQVASALDEAHQAGIVHRDIKPDNVMIRANGLAKILDFGIAKLSEPPAVAGGLNLGEEDATAIQKPSTSPGMIIGTANYMSPEQAKGKEIDARSDIFSFGIVFYEILTGKRAFEGETALESISSILKDEPNPISQILPEVPNEIERIVNKTLRKDREERYQTAKDLLIDLKDAKQSLELQNLMERSIVPNKDENKTQILKATTLDEINQTTTNQTVTGNSKTKYLAAGLLTLLLAVGGFFGYKYLTPSTTQINSIAVLPFENRSGNADSEYLSDGLAESLIYRLSQLPNLKVSPTSSVFRYKGKETDPNIIAKELGVDSVMTGRITQRGDNLTISVNLVDTRNGKSLWGEQYERKMSELLNTQREIASEITNKLQLKLSGESEQKLAKKYTDNNEAYQLYLQGRFHWNKRQTDEFEKAIVFFKQAIEKDPNYALAYTGLADTYSLFSGFSDFRPKEYMPRAKQAALKALELDPNLAEAHTSLAIVLIQYEYDFAGAEKSYKRAIELDPNYATAHKWYSIVLSNSSRHDEAIREITRAVELDPFSFGINQTMFWNLKFAGRYDDALLQNKKFNELFPDEGRFHRYNSVVYVEQGKYDQSVEEILLSAKAYKRPEEMIAKLKEAYEKGGWDGFQRIRQEIRLEELNTNQAKDPNGHVRPMDYAAAYAWGKDKDKTIEYLNKAYDERDRRLTELKVDKTWDFVRDDPRFKELVKKVGIPE